MSEQTTFVLGGYEWEAEMEDGELTIDQIGPDHPTGGDHEIDWGPSGTVATVTLESVRVKVAGEVIVIIPRIGRLLEPYTCYVNIPSGLLSSLTDLGFDAAYNITSEEYGKYDTFRSE
jgi:hypothetical protein